MENIELIIIPIIAIALLIVSLSVIPLRLWFRAMISGVQISITEIIFMKWRKVPVKEVVNALIVAHSDGLKINSEDLEKHAISGGNVQNVVNGMIYAKRLGIDLTLKNAIKADAMGLDIVDSFKERV
jgi:uncharacterized protein YqfA (UPF0365 family)